MKSSVKMVESALSGLPELTEENVGRGPGRRWRRPALSRTAGDGRPPDCILYRHPGGRQRQGRCTPCTTEIVAGSGRQRRLLLPVRRPGFPKPVRFPGGIPQPASIGAVYAYEYDTEQAELLQSFQTNLTRISLLIGVLVVALSALLSRALHPEDPRSCSRPSASVREGAYSHRASVPGATMKSPSWRRSSTA